MRHPCLLLVCHVRPRFCSRVVCDAVRRKREEDRRQGRAEVHHRRKAEAPHQSSRVSTQEVIKHDFMLHNSYVYNALPPALPLMPETLLMRQFALKVHSKPHTSSSTEPTRSKPSRRAEAQPHLSTVVFTLVFSCSHVCVAPPTGIASSPSHALYK